MPLAFVSPVSMGLDTYGEDYKAPTGNSSQKAIFLEENRYEGTLRKEDLLAREVTDPI